MLRSLYSGVSGMRAHQVRMDIIGNNIANVNTIGFKSGRVNFTDMLYQEMGNSNSQVGLGVKVGRVDTMFGQGALESTERRTDFALNGDGFFVLRTDANKNVYTRDGNFSILQDGSMVHTATNIKVQGFEIDPDTGAIMDTNNDGNMTLADLSDIVVQDYSGARTVSATAAAFTSTATTPTATPATMPTITTDGTTGYHNWELVCVDATSGSEKFDLYIDDVKVEGQQVTAGDNLNYDGLSIDQIPAGPYQVNDSFAWDTKPGAVFTGAATSSGTMAGPITDGTSGTHDWEVRRNAGAWELWKDGAQVMGQTPVEGTPFSYEGLTFTINQGNYADGDKFTFESADKSWELINMETDENGVITGLYESYIPGGDPIKKYIGKLGVVSFNYQEGLNKLGDNLMEQSSTSGGAQLNTGGLGDARVQAGYLEMSNVDLTKEFANMIITQRGYQANSRSITTSDTMLEELLSLKR